MSRSTKKAGCQGLSDKFSKRASAGMARVESRKSLASVVKSDGEPSDDDFVPGRKDIAWIGAKEGCHGWQSEDETRQLLSRLLAEARELSTWHDQAIMESTPETLGDMHYVRLRVAGYRRVKGLPWETVKRRVFGRRDYADALRALGIKQARDLKDVQPKAMDEAVRLLHDRWYRRK